MKRQKVMATNRLPYPIGSSVTSRDSACINDDQGRRPEDRHSGAMPAPYLIRGRSLGGAVKMDSGFRRSICVRNQGKSGCFWIVFLPGSTAPDDGIEVQEHFAHHGH